MSNEEPRQIIEISRKHLLVILRQLRKDVESRTDIWNVAELDEARKALRGEITVVPESWLEF